MNQPFEVIQTDFWIFGGKCSRETKNAPSKMTTRVFEVSPAGLMGLAHLVNVLGGQALQSHQLLLTEKTIALLESRLRPQLMRAINETPTKNDDLVSKNTREWRL
jgi:hypothetical protein